LHANFGVATIWRHPLDSVIDGFNLAHMDFINDGFFLVNACELLYSSQRLSLQFKHEMGKG
jgi:hypothetical protein